MQGLGAGRKLRSAVPIACLALLVTATAAAVPGDITTDAGGGLTGDGGLAIGAPLNQPRGVAVDGAGNVFIADAQNVRVRRVDPSGIITTVAGNGSSGFCGDGGPATAACLGYPTDVALDTAGNLYIADGGNNRVRKVDTSGIITTVAGNGSTSGVCGDGGAATAACIGAPNALAFDSAGDLYVTQPYYSRVRKISTTGTITTVAGNGSYGFCGDGGPATSACMTYPFDAALDGAGNLYITDNNNYRIRKVSTSGTISTVAGSGSTSAPCGDGGPATSACLGNPYSIAADGSGNLFIGVGWPVVRRVDAASGIITTVAGGTYGFCGDGGPATAACMTTAFGLASGLGSLYIADYSNNRVRKVDASGVITTIAGNGSTTLCGDGGQATNACLLNPRDVAVDAAGNRYIADTNHDRVRKVTPAGVITTVAGGTYGFCGDGGPAVAACLRRPTGVATDAVGSLYIADHDNHRIRKVDGSGIITTVAGNGSNGFCGDLARATNACLSSPTDVVVDQMGGIYISDSSNHRIRKVISTGGVYDVIITVAGNGGSAFCGDGDLATTACLSIPTGLALDSAGALYVADAGNNRIRKVTLVGGLVGVISTVAGNGTNSFCGDGGPAVAACLAGPQGVAVAAGTVFVSDTYNHRIRRISSTGVITTVAGTGTAGFCGDGGPAASACLSYPYGIGLDAAGNLLIADSNNRRTRRILGPIV